MKCKKSMGFKKLKFTMTCFSLLAMLLSSMPTQAEENGKETVFSDDATVSSTEVLDKLSQSEPLVSDATDETTSTSETNASTEELSEDVEAKVKSINVRADGVAVVSNWDEFVAALVNSSVSKITLGTDITIPDKIDGTGIFSFPEISTTATELDLEANKNARGNAYGYIKVPGSARTLVIDGAGFSLDTKNFAISFLDNNIANANYWNITLENITAKSSNWSGPIFMTDYQSAYNANRGLSNLTNTRNSSLNYSDTATNIRYVSDWVAYLAGLSDVRVSNMEFTTDIVSPEGTYNTVYYLNNPSSAYRISDTIGGGANQANVRAGNNHLYLDLANKSRKLVVNGNGYTIDYGSNDVRIRGAVNAATPWDLTLKNMTAYHANYWGAIFYDGISGKITFEDYTNYGNQVIESNTTTVVLRGKTHFEQVENYVSKGKEGNLLRNDVPWEFANLVQQSFRIADFTVVDGAEAYVSSRGTNTMTVWTGGSFTIGKDSKLTIERGSEMNNTEGVLTNLSIESGQFLVKEGAEVNILNHNTSTANAINMGASGATLTIEKNAKVNVLVDGYTGTSTVNNNASVPLYMAGGVMDVAGELNVKAENVTSMPSPIVYANATATFKVRSKGTLDIQSESADNRQNLIYMNGANSTFQFADAERVNLQRNVPLTTGTDNANSGLIRAYGKLNVSVQNVFQWEKGNLNFTGENGDEGFKFDFQPMSNMIIDYGARTGTPKIINANSIYLSTVENFKANFTTQAQRILFTRVPAPNIGVHSISNDNPEDPGSVTIHGYATPSTFIRLAEEPKNGTESALPAEGPEDIIETPIEDPSFDIDAVDQEGNKLYVGNPLKNFTVKSDANGDWTYTIASKDIKHFTANNVINVYGFNNLKDEIQTQIVLDKTAPTGTPVKYYVVKGDATPDASVFVKDAKDTNPVVEQAKVNYAYNAATDIETLMGTTSTEEAPHLVKIDISDSAVDPVSGEAAPNTRTIDAELVVLDSPVNIDLGADEITFEYKDIRELTDQALKDLVIKESGASGYIIDRGGVTDLTEFIIVSDLGGLNNIDDIVAADGNMIVTLMIPGAASGLDDYKKTVKVKVINLLSTLTVKFVNEADEEMPAYTLTITEMNGEKLVVSDKVDLTDPQHGVTTKLENLEAAGFEIVERPAKETEFYLDNTAVTAIYKVKGLVYLSSAPNSINFGTVTYDATVKRVDNGVYDQDLVVNDTRVTKTKWLLGAKVMSQMTNTEDSSVKLIDSLQYVNGDETIILNDGLQNIYQASETPEENSGVTNISDTWGQTKESNGIKLVVDPSKSKVLQGQYTGEIEWQFMEATP